MACELTAYPETYDVIERLIREGVEGKYPDVISSDDNNEAEAHLGSPLNKALRDIAILEGVLPQSHHDMQQQQHQETREHATTAELISILDCDVQQYLEKESETKKLRSLGFFHKDDFLTFS